MSASGFFGVSVHGNVHERERAHVLRPSVLEQLEIVGRQVGDRLPRRIGHQRIDLDVVDSTRNEGGAACGPVIGD